jgi:eukaryotic-like serine/threonine-protein kinase
MRRVVVGPKLASLFGEELRGYMKRQQQMLQVGEIIGEMYQIVSELGHGTMGVVYKAKRLWGGGEVAVKVLYSRHCHDQEQVSRFWQEMNLSRTLQHPNIVKVFDFGQSNKQLPYFVQELLRGKDLQEELELGNQFSIRQIIDLLVPVCAALEAAHQQNIVHRDLKPANIFMGASVKLIDFGLAKIRETKGVTTASGVVGTPAYMSPEQIRGEALDGRSDLYALGVILYQLLCGSLPFTGNGYLDIGEKILLVPAEDVRQRAKDKELPGALARLAMQCLSKERGDRPESAEEVLKRLLAIKATLDAEHAPERLARKFLEKMQSISRDFKSGLRPVVQKLKLTA